MTTPSYDLSELRRVLTGRFNEEELRDLCFDLQVDYESLPGSEKAGKARELVIHCERHNMMPKLVESVQKERPDVVLKDAGEQIKYCVASGKPSVTVAGRLHINDIIGANFEPFEDFSQADIIIFDLDNPPPDWLKYLAETQKRLVSIVFVAFDTDLQNRGPVELDGKNILDIFNRSYRNKARFQAAVCTGSEEFSTALNEVVIFLKALKDSRRMAARGV